MICRQWISQKDTALDSYTRQVFSCHCLCERYCSRRYHFQCLLSLMSVPIYWSYLCSNQMRSNEPSVTSATILTARSVEISDSSFARAITFCERWSTKYSVYSGSTSEFKLQQVTTASYSCSESPIARVVKSPHVTITMREDFKLQFSSQTGTCIVSWFAQTSLYTSAWDWRL